MSTLQKIFIILNNPADQDKQIKIIKTQALTGKVWKHLNPSEDTVPTLEEPVAPTPAQVNAAKITVIELTPDKCEQYKILQQDHKQEQSQYKKKETALSTLHTAIQLSVSRSYLYYTFKASNTCEILIELKKYFQSTN